MAKTSKPKPEKPADLARKAASVLPPKKKEASSPAIEAARRLMQGGKMDPSK